MARMKIIENFSVKAEDIRPVKRFDEALRVVEHEGKKYKCVAAFTFATSRPGQKNLNERIYPVRLWERVFERRQGEGRFGLCDHASDKSTQPDGSVKDAFCVWHNGRFNEDKSLTLWDCYLFGEWGRHAKEAIDAGGEIGLSSVGYGEFLDDDITIDPETFDLDHPADWVLNPSYEVFGHAEDEIVSTPTTADQDNAEPIVDSKPRTESTIKIKENTMGDPAADKTRELESRTFRLQITTLINEAEKKASLAEKRSSFVGLLEYFEAGMADDLRTQVTEKIAAIEKEMGELAEAGKGVPELTTAKKTLEEQNATMAKELTEARAALANKDQELSYIKESYEKSTQLCDSLKTYSNKLKEMFDLKSAELETRISATEYKELQVYCEELEAQIKRLKTRRREEIGNGPVDSLPAPATTRGDDPDQAERTADQGEKSTIPETDPNQDAANPALPTDEGAGSGEQNPPEDHPIPDDVPEIVADYYEDLKARNPRVRSIREDILRCRTLLEAETTYYRLRSLVEDRSALYHRDPRRTVTESPRFPREGGRAPEPTSVRPLPIRKGWN